MDIQTLIAKQSDINIFASVDGFLTQWNSTEPFYSGRPKQVGELKYWGWMIEPKVITPTGIELEQTLVDFAPDEFGILYEFDEFNNKGEELNIPYIQRL
jgi:hypothetical protein